MAHPFWPLFDLRLRTQHLELRPLAEADLADYAAMLPEDVDLDPAATTYDVEDRRTSNAIVVHQEYWRHYGTWHPDAWRLSFGVFDGLGDGRLLGRQELEGNDFRRLRTVDSSSFLAVDARGRGVGQAMRRAVLALAFGPLQAQAAIPSAYQDNHASIGVSRALGYRPNGESLERRDSEPAGVDLMVHLRLTRDDWLAGGGADQVAVSGFDRCRPLFGLGPG